MLKISVDTPLNKIVGNDFHRFSVSKYINAYSKVTRTNIILERPQYAFINLLNSSSVKFLTAVWARRLGKTFISNVAFHVKALEPEKQLLIVAPEYSLTNVSWEEQLKLINLFGIEIKKQNTKDKVILLGNNTAIRVASVNNINSALGRSYDFIYFDEAAISEDGGKLFDTVLMPTLDKPESKVVFSTTPRGKNWIYDKYLLGFDPEFPEWATIHADYRENSRLDEKTIKLIKRSMSRKAWEQEMEAKFISDDQNVYTFDRDKLIVDSSFKFKFTDTIIGIDFGFRDETAIVIMRGAEEYGFFIIDEYLNATKSTAEIAHVLREFIKKYDVDFIYADSANAQSRHDLAAIYGISTYKAKKSVIEGIRFVQYLIETDRLKVLNSCNNVIDTLENYSWKRDEIPRHDVYSHMADAIRYACFSHAHLVSSYDPLL